MPNPGGWGAGNYMKGIAVFLASNASNYVSWAVIPVDGGYLRRYATSRIIEREALTMDVINRLGNCGIVPVVVIDKAEDAVPTAKALLSGGIDVMEITLRTPAGMDAIRQVAQNCPDMCVGAGTVLTLEQCKQAVEAGARFIVSPGFDHATAKWCVENKVAITPGCVTPTEIMAALALGVNVVKFFPANVYGGLSAMKALSGPFGDVKFIPTGGVSADNLAEYAAAPFIHAVGGSWLCTKDDIAAGNFEKITALCAQAVKAMLVLEVIHVGINCENPEEAARVAEMFDKAFDTGIKVGISSTFAGPGLEMLHNKGLGNHGHIAMRTPHMDRAVAALARRGFECDMSTAKYVGDTMTVLYLKEQFGGFAVHLMKK